MEPTAGQRGFSGRAPVFLRRSFLDRRRRAIIHPLWQPRQGPTVVTGWRPIPRFRASWEQTGSDVAALVVAAMVDAAPASAPGFHVADLEPNLLNVGTSTRV